MRLKQVRVLCGVTVWVVMAGCWMGAQTAKPAMSWVGSWVASQQVPETQNSLDPELLRDATLRQIVHLSVGGSQLRVRVSNAFGPAPLHLTAVHVARPVSAGNATIDASSDRAVTFNGTPDVTIPAGAEYLSDAVAFQVAALANLAISIHLISRLPARRDIRVRERRRIWCMAMWSRRRIWQMPRRWSTGTKSRVWM